MKIFWNIEVLAVQKHVNLVDLDLVKSYPTNIYLQNLASIEKRTSPVKFAHLAEKSGKGSISNLSTKVRVAHGRTRGEGQSLCSVVYAPRECLWPWERAGRLKVSANFERLVLGCSTRLNDLDEIYNIYKLLLRFELKNSAKVRQRYSHFCSFIFKVSLMCWTCCQKFKDVDYFFRNFSYPSTVLVFYFVGKI